MLRAVSAIYVEGQALELLAAARRDVYKLFRTSTLSTAAAPAQTVLTSDGIKGEGGPQKGGDGGATQPPLPPSPPPPRRAWTLAAAALAVTASLGGVYFYRKLTDEEEARRSGGNGASEGIGEGAVAPGRGPEPYPAAGADLPPHVQYLLVGAGTASFAAMRAIRSARPDAQVLLVGEEPELPYMRPPLSKELWREPDLPQLADDSLDAIAFRQWNGKRRPLAYEPAAFYAPIERLGERQGGGATVARGWRVTRLRVASHEAELRAPGCDPVTVRFDKCLVATGLRARRTEQLRAARDAGLSLALRDVRDATRLARALHRTEVRRVAVLGGGFLASELSAALAERLRAEGKTVTQVFREEAPLAGVLPPYLAEEAARRLRESGVRLLPLVEVTGSEVEDGVVRMTLEDGGRVEAELVVECVGGEVDERLPRASGLETHPELGGVLVNAELQARSDVYAAGDVACFYDVALGRRRVEHHDHAVVSGRLAGENMAALKPPRHYDHQSMFWSDLGPQLGYEAIGIVDSRLRTVGVFSADAVSDAARALEAGEGTRTVETGEATRTAASESPRVDDACSRRYERGVVFYLRDSRVVGVLLWNLFNRMHVARQVLAEGEFEDLFEVAKLFSLHEDD